MDDILKGLSQLKQEQQDLKYLNKFKNISGGITLANTAVQINQNYKLLKEISKSIKNLIRNNQVIQITEKIKLCWKTNLAVSAIVGGLRIYDDFQLYSKNVIDGKELAKKIARHIITIGTTSAASYGGFVMGAQLGSVVPVVGTIIGGVAGGLFAGLLAEELTTKACKIIMNEKEYQLDVLQQNYNNDIQKLYQCYMSALQRRGLTEYSSDNEIKQKKKQDFLGLHPDKFADPARFSDSDRKWAAQQFILANVDYEIIKAFREMNIQ